MSQQWSLDETARTIQICINRHKIGRIIQNNDDLYNISQQWSSGELSRQLICRNCHKIDGIIQNNYKMYRIVVYITMNITCNCYNNEL